MADPTDVSLPVELHAASDIATPIVKYFFIRLFPARCCQFPTEKSPNSAAIHRPSVTKSAPTQYRSASFTLDCGMAPRISG
jgi:hypothetical protein